MSTFRARRFVRRLSTLVVVSVLAVVVAACGTASDGAEGNSGVRMEHKYGTTELPENPRKVVALGLNDQEALLALGIKPVGVVDWFGERPYGNWPWTKPKWGETKPEIVGERDDYQLEKIAKLQPDLIIAQYSGMTKEQYEKLAKIAPTVAQPPGQQDYAAPWRLMTERIGKAVGKQQQATKLIDGVDAKFAAVRQEHPEFAEQSIVVADSFQPGEYALFADHDAKAEFALELGFQGSSEITELAGDNNAAEVSSERLDLVADVDRMLWTVADDSVRKRVQNDEVYQRSKVAREDASVFVTYYDPPVGAAVSFNTVLSIPYAIDRVVPLLEQTGPNAR
ncbi:iron complex transport system substrate-binding protein [Tamaricihabitans halophyticus]|uniref:Iron complex transport system substrate-binding protein n=1 Tax=Tamaricihabitans halophyticus TaxID=1262583 RepID=A0A4R2QUH5_9PSEU|nr:iron-siderophore ABC transporter substrate-binding protein [Tamaricihabitans halophyticus]TCP53633.1 iron complex transport system substrate-binding protein [Tamaricihabitans halophyticus]